MRIVHVVPSFGLGGMEKIICAVLNSTAKTHDHVVVVLVDRTHAAAWIRNSSIQIIKLTRPASRSLFFVSLYSALRRSQADVLFTYNWGATDGIWLGRLAGIRKIIHNEHGFSAEEARKTLWVRDWIRFFVYRLSSEIIVVSHELQELLSERFLVRQKRIRRIPNGIDVNYYCPDKKERQRVRKYLGFSDTECVIGFSGRLDPVKNLDLLFEIFRSSNPHKMGFRLLIIGDGPERPRFEARCELEGLLRYVKFVGQQTDVLPYLRAMDVFLLTSLCEQMPVTILEAMSVGLPVVSTNVGELRHIVDDGIEGFIRDLDGSVDNFVETLKSLLCASKRRKLGIAARQKVVEQFQIGATIQEYAELMEEYTDSLAR